MARPLRVYVPDAWYHVTARGNERRAIVRDDGNRDRFLTRLAAKTKRFGLNLYAYGLQNRFHLLVEPREVMRYDTILFPQLARHGAATSIPVLT